MKHLLNFRHFSVRYVEQKKTRTFISFRLLFFCFGFSSSSLPSFCFSSSLVLTSGCEGRKYLKYDSYCSMLVNWSAGDHRYILMRFCALVLRAGYSTMAFKPHVRPSCFISSQRALNLPDILGLFHMFLIHFCVFGFVFSLSFCGFCPSRHCSTFHCLSVCAQAWHLNL